MPQIIVPELLYNVTIASLTMAASYHLLSLVQSWWRNRAHQSRDS